MKILVPVVTETRVGGPSPVIEISAGCPMCPRLVNEIGDRGPYLVTETRLLGFTLNNSYRNVILIEIG